MVRTSNRRTSRRSLTTLRRQLLRRACRPLLERLETRLAPANVDLLSNHYDRLLSGANTREEVLTPANVNSTNFGRLFSYPVDGYVYAQPLYKANLVIPGRGTRNVVFVATQHDSVYALDADNPNPATGGGLFWQRGFINPAAGITTVPAPQDVGSSDIVPEIGITGTPVIDPATNTLYVVDKTKEVRASVAHYVQKLHALDLATGAERPNSPLVLGDTILGGPEGGHTNVTNIAVPGTGAGSFQGMVKFNALRQLQRPALQLVGSRVYVAWASHGDQGPYHGWVIGFNKTTLQIEKVFNTSPDVRGNGIWQSGGALAADAQDNLYFAIGNGFGSHAFDGDGPTALGDGGGALGYGPLNHSVAVVFRNFPTQTGLGTNGSFQPGVPIPGFDFNASAQATPRHTFRATLSYDGTTLTETLQNLTTGAMFNTSFPVNISALVGGNTAFVGFTGGTGGLNAQQDIQTWTYTPQTGTG